MIRYQHVMFKYHHILLKYHYIKKVMYIWQIRRSIRSYHRMINKVVQFAVGAQIVEFVECLIRNCDRPKVITTRGMCCNIVSLISCFKRALFIFKCKCLQFYATRFERYFFKKWIDIQSKTRKERQGEKNRKKHEGGLPPLILKAWKDNVYIK